MKKVLGFISIILIIFTLATGVIVSSAETSGKDAAGYSVDSTTVECGSDFSLVVSINNNPGVISLRFEVIYDESLLKLNSVEDLGLLGGYFPPAPQTASPYTLRWSTPEALEGSTASGELIKLNFTAVTKSDALAQVKISHVEANDGNGKSKTFADTTANIDIKNKYTVKFLAEDGQTVLSEQKYFPGESVTAPDDPIKESDELNKYVFAGWTPEVEPTATADAVYTATYTSVLLETDSTMKSLSATGIDFMPEFDPRVTEYGAMVDYSVSEFNIVCETASEFATYVIEGASLRVGENTVKVIVTAENKTTTTYTFTITRTPDPNYTENDDSSLKELVPSCGVLSPAFSSDKTSYILYVEFATTEVSFVCTANNEKSRVSGADDPFTLDGNRLSATFVCTAENGDTTDYTVNVVRLPENNGEIPEFVFGGDKEDEGGDGEGTDNGDEVKDDEDGVKDDEDGVKNENNGSDVHAAVSKIPDTTVIIIIVAASLCAIASVVGIIFLIASGRKKKEK